MDFRQLQAFVAVALLKSFSKAADQLYVTQPTISGQMQSLEQELGTVLIERTSRSLRLTSAGEVFFPYAKEILNLKEKATSSVEEHKGNIRGKLEIAASTIPQTYLLPSLMGEFHQLHQEVEYHSLGHDSAEVIDQILNGRLDFGFVGYRQESKFLEYVKIYEDELAIIGPKSMGIVNKELNFDDIAQQKWILREKGSGTRDAFEEILGDNGVCSDNLSIVACLESNEAIKQWVRQGMGISIMSKAAIKDELAHGDLITLKIGGISLKRDIYFVYHRNRTMSPLAETFKQFVLNKYL